MFNKIILLGRICHDLELKTTPTGVTVLSFRIAVDRNYQTKGEERKADFFNIVAWRGTAEFVSKCFGKGRMIMVDGELQTREYIDKENITRHITEIVANSVHFTGEKKAEQQPQSHESYTQPQNPPTGGTSNNAYVCGAVPNATAYPQPQQAQPFAPASADDDDYPF